MDLFLQGLIIGATLTVMVGPITFTILDASLTRGVRFGIVTAFGMWCSDILYILLCYLGAQQLRLSFQSPEAGQWIGVLGGIILITIGVFIWRSRRNQETIEDTRHKLLHYTGHWFRGFVVNTFAPFSLFFWPTVTLTIVLPTALTSGHASAFYIGVMSSIMAGDMLKAVFAAWISQRIAQNTLVQIRTGLAFLFVVIGLFSLGKVVWEVV
jgi:threonine/homoserine/homoserine lactone efflux protein